MNAVKTPGKNHSAFRLFRRIIALSEGDTWAVARQEWQLQDIFFVPVAEQAVLELDDDLDQNPSGQGYGRCLCGHQPIVEHCLLRNIKNGKQAIVGNVCVNKFLGFDTEPLFTAFKRIAHDSDQALCAAAVDYAHHKGWLNDWERGFYKDTCRKRKPTERQLAKRRQINELVLLYLQQAAFLQGVNHE
jgi:hypothetical protein